MTTVLFELYHYFHGRSVLKLAATQSSGVCQYLSFSLTTNDPVIQRVIYVLVQQLALEGENRALKQK